MLEETSFEMLSFLAGTPMEWLNLIVSALGFIVSLLGLVGVGVLLKYLKQLSLSRRYGRALLRFTKGSELAVIVSTSTNNDISLEQRDSQSTSSGIESNDSSPNYPRPTISIWSAYAINYVHELWSALRYEKSPEMNISERFRDNQEGDLVLIGGEIKSKRAKDFVRHFNREFPHMQIKRENTEDPCEKRMFIGETEYSTKLRENDAKEAISDRAIVVMWRNPFVSDGTWRRGIMCAGFSSRGTAAAARYLSQSIQNDKLRERCLAQEIPVKLRGDAPEFILILDITINNDEYADVEVYDFLPLRRTRGIDQETDQRNEHNAAVGH